MDKYTGETYAALQDAYDHFNSRLFNGGLRQCLITLQRHKGAYGYYAESRFSNGGDVVVDEIALNPLHFNRDIKLVLSTLVHEMVHLQEHQQYKAPRAGYHDKLWGNLMEGVGLIPSSTGEAGGKRTGQRVSHYIVAGGAFDKAVDELIAKGFIELLVDIWKNTPKKVAKKTRAKYTCPSCGMNAWAAPASVLVCGDCRVVMASDDE